MAKLKEFFRTNNQITHLSVRVVGDNIESKVCSINEAKQIAENAGLDLVEITKDSNPPVCRVCDYQKFLYERKLKEKQSKKNTSKVTLKELRFTPTTDDHDFNFKKNHASEFLKKGNKVKATVFFKGREIIHKEMGEILLLKLATELEDVGRAETLPKLEGKFMIMILSPRK